VPALRASRSEDLVPPLAGLSLGALMPGNSVELLRNERYFEVLLERMGRARRTVHLETYLWGDGAVSDRLTEALCGRARAGLQVRVLFHPGASSTSE
jgi:cardiolipin synthase